MRLEVLLIPVNQTEILFRQSFSCCSEENWMNEERKTKRGDSEQYKNTGKASKSDIQIQYKKQVKWKKNSLNDSHICHPNLNSEYVTWTTYDEADYTYS